MPVNAWINVKTDYGAVGNGTADDTVPLRSAVADAIQRGGATVYLPAGNYRLTAGLDVKGSFSLLGDGEGTILHSTDATRSVLKITGATGSTYSGFTIRSTAVKYADRNAVANGLYLLNAKRCNVSELTVTQTYAAGIFLASSENCKVMQNNVMNTLSDGIHLTSRCTGCVVSNNTLSETGDDGIAVVSYRMDAAYCERIVITGNTVINSWSRGIAHVGGKQVTIADNQILNSAASGILVVEDTNYATYEPWDTIIHHNQIVQAGAYSPQRPLTGNRIGIEVGSGAKGVHIEGNRVREPQQDGIVVTASGDGLFVLGNYVVGAAGNGAFLSGVSQITFTGNTLENNVRYGLYASKVNYGVFTNNQFLNNNCYDRLNPGTGTPDANTQATDNANFSSCKNCTLSDNISIDNRTDRARARIERAIEIGSGERIKSGGNICYVYNPDDTQALRQESFIINAQSCERTDAWSGTGAPTTGTYQAGQLYFRTDTQALYVYDGAAWRKVTLG